ncbi:MAG: hypothetical protein ACK4RM_01135 [Flavobacterium sp.]
MAYVFPLGGYHGIQQHIPIIMKVFEVVLIEEVVFIFSVLIS